MNELEAPQKKAPLNPKVKNGGIVGILTIIALGVIGGVLERFGFAMSPEIYGVVVAVVAWACQVAASWYTTDNERGDLLNMIEGLLDKGGDK